MGVINYAVHHCVTGNAFLVRWASLSSSSGSLDVGVPFPSSIDVALAGSLYSDKSVQAWSFVPNTASLSRCLIQGCNNMTVTESDGSLIWATLTDAQGNPLTFDGGAVAPPRMEQVLENTWYIRPAITSGTSVVTSDEQLTIDLLITSVRSSRSGI